MVSAFHFWGLSPFEVPLIVTACLYFAFIQRHLGRYLLKSSGIFTQILIGLCASAAILSFLISFSAGLGRIFIYSEGLILTCLELSLLLKNRNAEVSFHRIYTTLIIICFVSIFASFNLIRSFTLDGKLITNAHQIYMSGVPIEILNSDYFTRIRVFDNYPLVFEKFHFLYASMSAIIMAPSLTFNYFTYVISKIIIFLIAVLVGFELMSVKLKSKHMSTQTIMLFGFCAFSVIPTSVVWASNTNNSLPAILILAGLLAFSAEKNRTSLAFLLFFCISTSRSLIPGLTLIFLIFLVNPFRRNETEKSGFLSFVFKITHQRLVLDKSLRMLFGIFFLGLFSLVMTGYAVKPIGRNTLIATFTEPLKKLFPTDWLAVMSPGSFVLQDVIYKNTYYLSQNFRFSFFIFCTVAFLQIIQVLKLSSKSLIGTRSLTLLLPLFYLTTWLVFPKDANLTVFADYYAAPILIIIFLAPCQLRLPMVGFILASIVQIMFLAPDVAFPNWFLTEWICIAFVSIRLISYLGNRRFMTLIFCLVLVVQHSIGPNIGLLFRQDGRDSTTHVIRVSSLPAIDSSLKAWCHTTDNEDTIMAIRGKRVYANTRRSGRYTVTRGFIMEHQKLLPLPSFNCQN